MSETTARKRFPWPRRRPNVPRDPQGWFQKRHATYLAPHTGLHVTEVVELGSWLGKSTRWWARNCPQATVYAVDTWRGSEEHRQQANWAAKLPRLYETFLANCWGYRKQIVPVRMDSREAIACLRSLGVTPQVVYIDAAHDEESVYRDVREAAEAWPRATLTGDDWPALPVQRGVQRAWRELRPDRPGWRLNNQKSPGRCWSLVAAGRF